MIRCSYSHAGIQLAHDKHRITEESIEQWMTLGGYRCGINANWTIAGAL